MNPICAPVEAASSCFRSVWATATSPSTSAVAAPVQATAGSPHPDAASSGPVRSSRYAPAATMEAECSSAETGLGPSIARDSQNDQGSCADLPNAASTTPAATTSSHAGDARGRPAPAVPPLARDRPPPAPPPPTAGKAGGGGAGPPAAAAPAGARGAAPAAAPPPRRARVPPPARDGQARPAGQRHRGQQPGQPRQAAHRFRSAAMSVMSTSRAPKIAVPAANPVAISAAIATTPTNTIT